MARGEEGSALDLCLRGGAKRVSNQRLERARSTLPSKRRAPHAPPLCTHQCHLDGFRGGLHSSCYLTLARCSVGCGTPLRSYVICTEACIQNGS